MPVPAFDPGRDGRILIADDDVDIRETVSRILGNAGYSTLAVADGERRAPRCGPGTSTSPSSTS